MRRLTDRQVNLSATDLRKRARARARLETDRTSVPHIQVNFVSGRATDRGFVRDAKPVEVRAATVGGETIRRRDDESEAQFKTRVLGAQLVGRPTLVVWTPGDLPPAPNISIRPPLPPEV